MENLKRTEDELVININFDKEMVNDFNNFLQKVNINIISNNYYKKSRGRKSWRNEHLNLLQKCYMLFGEELDIAKSLLPDFNLNQIYRKFQFFKLNKSETIIKEEITKSALDYKNKFSKFKKKKKFIKKNDTDKMIESFVSMNLKNNLENNKNKSNHSFIDFNLDNFVLNNKSKFSFDIIPSIQKFTDKSEKSDKSSMILYNTNDSFKSYNNLEIDNEIKDIFNTGFWDSLNLIPS